MCDPIVARQTLNKARLFLGMASRLSPNDRDEFLALMEAAIVFGRAVTNHIQKEFRHRDGFEEWYTEHAKRLQADPLARFIYKQRSFILKQGQLAATRVIEVSAIDAVAVGEPTIALKIIRSAPWYHRNPRLIFEDLRRGVITLLRKLRPSTGGRMRDHVIVVPGTQLKQTWQLDHPDWNNRPAADVVHAYLGQLEPIVSEAEQKFGEKPGQ